jgi:hypothetical protein
MLIKSAKEKTTERNNAGEAYTGNLIGHKGDRTP